MIEAAGLTKRFGATVAVDHLGFTVRPGRVTGFLGPNGSGKSTTMRLMLGLDRGEGTTTFDGRQIDELDHPLRQVGSLLDPGYVHPGRSARNHLRVLARAADVPDRRVDEVLDLVGITEVAKRSVGGFSLGMKQRLGLAAALLGDPHTLLLDEPANGLDPEGMLWVRTFLRWLADQGRTVFVSSHLLAEMAQVADDLVVIGQGRLIFAGAADDFVGRFAGESVVLVRSPQASALAARLREAGAVVSGSLAPPGRVGELTVVGPTAAEIGEAAAAAGIVLHLLAPQQPSLEEAFLEVTKGAREFVAGGPSGGGAR